MKLSPKNNILLDKLLEKIKNTNKNIYELEGIFKKDNTGNISKQKLNRYEFIQILKKIRNTKNGCNESFRYMDL